MVIVIILVSAGSFYGGMLYGKSQNPAAARMAQFRNGGQLGPGGTGNGTVRVGQNDGFTSGEIISKDDKSITVKLENGGSKIIFFSDSTTVGKFTQGTAADLAIGQTVSANGTANSDGSITATQIQIRPVQPTQGQGQSPTSTTNTAQ